MLENAILIAGPTASGKSGLALRMARATGGSIVNADSMQVYGVLDVLTARPGAADLAAAPHHLYGHVDPGTAYSTGAWLRDVEKLIGGSPLAGRRAIFVGGTGLYFEALTRGLSAMPDIEPARREAWRRRLSEEGAARLHEELGRLDPAAAARTRPSDGQRIVRALEVFDASGRSIVDWQGQRSMPLVDEGSAVRIVIEPDRALLAQRIEARLRRMVRAGALDEVREIQGRRLDPSLPAMKAIGVREFADHLAGGATLEEVLQEAAHATRQYARRQATWMRNRLGPGWRRIGSADEIEGDFTAASNA